MLQDGQVQGAERRTLLDHLNSCEKCRAYSADLHRAAAVIRESSRVLARSPRRPILTFDRVLQLKRKKLLARIHRLLLLAAGSLLLGLIGFVAYNEHRTIRPFDVSVFGPDELAPGQSSILRLWIPRAAPPALEACVRLKERVIGKGRAAGPESVLSIPISVPNVEEGRYVFDVQIDTPDGRDALSYPVLLRRSHRILLTLDKPLYQPSQVVRARALVIDEASGRPAAGKEVQFTIENSQGHRVLNFTATTSEFGIAWVDFPLAEELVFGSYEIAARVGDVASERTFEVRQYVLPKFRVKGEFDKPFYRPGDPARLSISASYSFGGPVEIRSAKVRVLGIGEFDGRIVEFKAPEAESVQCAIEATDGTGHTESARVTVPVSRDPFKIRVTVLAGKFLPNQENPVHLSATYPDGRAAAVTFLVRGEKIRSDAGGAARVMARETRFTVEATDDRGERAIHAADLTSTLQTHALALYIDSSHVRSGEPLPVRVLCSELDGRVFLDLQNEGRTLCSRTLNLRQGAACTTIDIPSELSGPLELRAWHFGEMLRFDRKVLDVARADALSVRLTPVRPALRGGEPIEVDVEVRAAGQGVASAVGLSAVDSSVLWLGEEEPEAAPDPRHDLPRPAAHLSHYDRLANLEYRQVKAYAEIGRPLLWLFIVTAGALCVFWFFSKMAWLYVVSILTCAPCVLAGILLVATAPQNSPIPRSDSAPGSAPEAGGGAGSTNFFCIFFLSGGGSDTVLSRFFADPSAPRQRGEEIIEEIIMVSPPRAEPRVRTRFPETLYWNPQVITDPRGRARVTLPAADSITTWTLRAGAVDADGRQGSAQLEIPIRRDFFIDLDLPVSLTQGDEIEIPVMIYNGLDSEEQVRVALEPAEWYRAESVEARVRLAARSTGSAGFRLKVVGRGRSKLAARAYARSDSDAVEREIEIVPKGRPVEETISDRLVRRARAVLRVPSDSSEAWVRLYPTPMSQVVTGLERLVRLPYG
jgi:5-hydroxyisourate hydrolase-like protein (transthyretin family)